MQDHRAVPRVRTNVAAMVKDGERFQICRLLDLSVAGTCMDIGVPFRKGETIQIHFDFSDYVTKGELVLPAMVMWEKDVQGLYRYGLFFTSVSDTDLSKLVHVVDVLRVLQ